MNVFKMNECDWVASKLSKEETNEWYKKEFGYDDEEQTVEMIEECDIKKDGMYTQIEIEEAHALLEKLSKGEKVKGSRLLKFSNYDDLCVWVTFEQELNSYEEVPEKPFIICTSEY